MVDRRLRFNIYKTSIRCLQRLIQVETTSRVRKECESKILSTTSTSLTVTKFLLLSTVVNLTMIIFTQVFLEMEIFIFRKHYNWKKYLKTYFFELSLSLKVFENKI